MFTIYTTTDEIIFVPEQSIMALKYNRHDCEVVISHPAGRDVLTGVVAVSYSSQSMPLTLKYKH